MGKSIDYELKCKVMKRGIIAQYRMRWKELDEALFHIKPKGCYYSPDYIMNTLWQIEALIPILYYAFDSFPHKQVYERVTQLMDETIKKYDD